MRTWVFAAAGCLVLSATVSADTLVMRDGRRVQGQLIGVRGDTIEFDSQRSGSFGGRERIHVDRRDVQRIDLDDAGDRGDRFGSDGERSNSDRDRVPDRQDRPSGLRERSLSVDSWNAWSDSGVDVRPGQMVYFTATGRVRWGPNRQDTPSGERNSPRNDARPIPGRPAAGLIGRIGETSDYFFIGDDEGPVRMRAGGRLYLGVNDDFLKDNTGSFRVTVFY
jgi:hypothetical protein